jgi:hypothetical protein
VNYSGKVQNLNFEVFLKELAKIIRNNTHAMSLSRETAGTLLFSFFFLQKYIYLRKSTIFDSEESI